MISIRNVSHKYGSQNILSDLSVDFPKGKVTALIGPNGAGKSTLLSLISRQTDLKSGQITLDDVNINDFKPKDLALRMALVTQQNGVESRLRVRDLVGFGRWPQHQGRPCAEDHIIIDQAIQKFELEDISTRFLDEISGGQKQRAFIAMAYAQTTDWLLLDEPLNNLDIRHAKTLIQYLRKLAHYDQKSIIMVIHDINYAISGSDHIIALKNGKLSFCGQTEEVATSNSLSSLYETSIDVVKHGDRAFAYHHNAI